MATCRSWWQYDADTGLLGKALFRGSPTNNQLAKGKEFWDSEGSGDMVDVENRADGTKKQ